MRTMRLPRWTIPAAWLLGLAATACDAGTTEPSAESAPAAEAPDTVEAAGGAAAEGDAPASQLVRDLDPPSDADDLETALWALAREVGPDMEWHAPTQRGRLEEGANADALAVLYDARCYRIVAAGGDDVRELSLFLYDPNGVLARQDAEEGPRAVLGRDHPVCIGESGAWRVRVEMTGGEGPWALRVLRSQL